MAVAEPRLRFVHVSLAARLADDIRNDGPMPFDRWMQRCLYDDADGFYRASGRAGRSTGDFITSPEVGPLFGAVVARALDSRWNALNRPDPFVVFEAAAGVGTLARTVIATRPKCRVALQWVAVETSPILRSQHSDLIRAGHLSTNEIPHSAHVGLANELLDNLPVRLLQRTDRDWQELFVGLDPAGNTFTWRAGTPDGAVPDQLADGTGIPVGTVMPVAQAAAAWVDAARTRCSDLIVLDYGPPRTDGSTPVRTYRTQERGNDPLRQPGQWDITCDVPFDQLPQPSRHQSQAEWLHRHGIADLVDEGRQIWTERAAIGDLAALRARSRVSEAQALLDPNGLGAFHVLEWSTSD